MEGKTKSPWKPKDREPVWLTALRVAGLLSQLLRLWIDIHSS